MLFRSESIMAKKLAIFSVCVRVCICVYVCVCACVCLYVWMAKVRMPKGLELENAVAVAGGGVSITPVLQMVERVQFLGDFSFSKFSFGGLV